MRIRDHGWKEFGSGIRDGKNSVPGWEKFGSGYRSTACFHSEQAFLCLQVIGALSDRQFANSLRGVQEQLGQFNAYRC
jgi:hypothetical protein